MTQFIFVVCALVCLASSVRAAVQPHPPVNRTHMPNEFVIDLDKSHEDRWRELAQVKHDDLMVLIDYLYATAPYKYVLPVANWLLDPLIHYFGHSDYMLEVKALAKLSGVKVGTIAVLQYMYELNANNGKMCTAVLAKHNNSIIHLRNLDYDFAEMLAGMSVQLNFKKNGKSVWTAVTQAGFLGAHTGIAFGRFALNVNERDKGSMLANLWSFITGKWGVSFLVRHVLETANTYNDAVEILKKEQLIAPTYFIISGINADEGLVITRNRANVHNIISIQDAANDNKSYIVQTNYDREVPDPEDDYRRIPAEQKMTALGDQLSEQQVMQTVMSQFPNLNVDTLLTSTMSASKHYLNTTIWY